MDNLQDDEHLDNAQKRGGLEPGKCKRLVGQHEVRQSVSGEQEDSHAAPEREQTGLVSAAGDQRANCAPLYAVRYSFLHMATRSEDGEEQAIARSRTQQQHQQARRPLAFLLASTPRLLARIDRGQ